MHGRHRLRWRLPGMNREPHSMFGALSLLRLPRRAVMAGLGSRGLARAAPVTGELAREARRSEAARALPVRQDCTLGCTESVCGRVPETCPIFPPNNIWNTPIDTLPADPRSEAYVAIIGLDSGVHPDFGAGLYEGSPLGIPFVRVPGNQP